MAEWIPVEDHLPKPKSQGPHMGCFETCLVVVVDSKYPCDPYDPIDSPTETSFVEKATYDAIQKVWNFDNMFAINALLDPDDTLEGMYVSHWMPWPEPSKER